MFIGRAHEQNILNSLQSTKKGTSSASLIIVYGRRRTGKTTLIEHVFGEEKLLKIEGVEGKDESYQLQNFIETVATYFNDPIVRATRPTNWKHAFEILARLVTTGRWVIYLEELQWMAEYKHDLIAELKPVWDNMFSKNPELVFVLCGSSPSFFITHVIRSQALHNRSSLELKLEEFPIAEARAFLPGKSLRSVFDAYLTVGGIPIYLSRLTSESSVYLSLCANSFRKDSFFAGEHEKVFVSSFGKNKTYRHIVEIISKHGNISRQQLAKAIKLESGGTLTNFLIDLEECGFIKRVVPLGKSSDSLLGYYQIRDPYLHFYFKFIKPNLVAIQNGDYNLHPERLLDMKSYAQWLGFSFERFCRNSSERIASLLGFSGVRYQSGVFFKRRNINDFGAQVDLLFDRSDRVKTVCEVKYQDAPVGLEVINAFEQKVSKLELKPSDSLQRVLITASGISQSLEERHYFDRVIGVEEMVKGVSL